MTPKFHELEMKIRAREELVRIYTSFTGESSIPADKNYWTLCGRQPRSAGSEICQLTRMNFITQEQFHGVDYSDEVIKLNKKDFPGANWHTGEWTQVIRKNLGIYNPGAVYLDTMKVSGNFSACQITEETMMYSKVGMVLFVNVMLKNPYNGEQFNGQSLIDQLQANMGRKVLSCFREYKPRDGSYSGEALNSGMHFTYSATGITPMATYAFLRT